MQNKSYLNDVSYHRRITRLDMVHHLLGNGHVQAVVQVTENLSARNALVLHLMNPERFADRHKSDSYTYHQQVGPEYTMVGVQFAGNFYVSNPRQTACDLEYKLGFDQGLPVFSARYPLDYNLEGERAKTPFNIHEQIFCPANYPGVIRRVKVINQRGLDAADAKLFATLVPNQALFPEAHYLSGDRIALAGQFSAGEEFLGLAAFTEITGHSVEEFPGGLKVLESGSLEDVTSCDDEHYVRPKQTYTNYPLLPISPHIGPVLALEFDLGRLEPEESRQVDLIYAIGGDELQVVQTVNALRMAGVENLWEEAHRYWATHNHLQFDDGQLNNLFHAAQSGLRASISSRGKMNAGIWGYGAEWVRDSSLACVGAILSGQFELARDMLVHMMDDMVSPEGIAFGEGQFYDIQRAELDQNGELLHAIWTYWVHSRDESLLRERWEVISRLADFPLRPEFWVEEASMLRGERDVRERDFERHGLLPGFELAHQMWVSLGLKRAADMADHLGEPQKGAFWREMGERIWHAVLHHPKFKLVENDYLMKRRLLDGSFQRFAKSRPYVHRPTEEPVTKMYPRSLARSGALEPDASEAWPIAYSLVDPKSALARRTLLRMEQLWNQEWDFGGYPLHNVDSEPTKFGPWPMTFYMITQAAAEAENYATVRRNLNWYLNTKDGRGFMWWEYRDADPDLQIDHGVIPWLIYGEPLTLLVRNLIGYRPGPEVISLRPHLLPEWKQVQARMRSGSHWVNLVIHHNGSTLTRAEVDGKPWGRIQDGVLQINIPTSDVEIEAWME